MESEKPIADDEVILRRVTGDPNNLKYRPGIGLTGTSFAISPYPPGEPPSWSRASITSACKLLEIEQEKREDMAGWSVIALTAKDVRAVKLDVRADPTDEDSGHCLIVPTAKQPFKDQLWRKLAKKTRVILTLPKKDG